MLYLLELIVFFLSAIFSAVALVQWYVGLFRSGLAPSSSGIRLTLMLLPLAALAIIIWTLRNLASFDVVEDGFYLLLYAVLGLAWAFIGAILMFPVLDLSRTDDLLAMNNPAAAVAFSGGFLAITIIYAGANIGDGPGCWCVLLAGGLGVLTWFALAYAFNLLTGASERITVERNVATGIRKGAFLLGSGFIIARASAGDWTSFFDTIVEFMVGWPVLILTVAAILIEQLFRRPATDEFGKVRKKPSLLPSILIALLYLAAAAAIVYFLPPMVENPMYDY